MTKVRMKYWPSQLRDRRQVAARFAFLFVFAIAACGEQDRSSATAAELAGAETVTVNAKSPAGPYLIEVKVSGLSGNGLVLQSNDGDELAIDANGVFAFDKAAVRTLAINVKTQPTEQYCSVLKGEHSGSTGISPVNVRCLTPVALDAVAFPQTVVLRWNGDDAVSYDVYYSTDPGCDLEHIKQCRDGAMIRNVISPHEITGLTNGRHYNFWLKAHHADGHVFVSESGARPDRLATNGAVYALAASTDGTIYLGGEFTHAGARSGGVVPLRTDSIGTHPFPPVAGFVKSLVPDGAGGWYIGGRFTHVGGVPRNNIAHILADGSVDSWNPGVGGSLDPVWGGTVPGINAMLVSGNTIYVAGLFTEVSGQERGNIAAIDLNTGMATAFNPTTEGLIDALAISGTTLYVGGKFFTIDGLQRAGIAAIDTQDEAGKVTAWDPGFGNVSVLAMKGTMLYAAGEYMDRMHHLHYKIAEIDTLSDNPSGDAWATADGPIFSLAVRDSTVYVAGQFKEISGEKRSHIAALDMKTGKATPWNPDSNDIVRALGISDTTIYAGGRFTEIGGRKRSYLAALDTRLNTNNATAWDPSPNAPVGVLGVSGTTLYASGSFTGIGGRTRKNLAALDANGRLAPWAPNADGRVLALAVSGSIVYAGGEFENIGGIPRSRIAALDARTGHTTAWDPGADQPIRALAISGSTVYAGGLFNEIGGQARNYIAALGTDAGRASITAWDPNADAPVLALQVKDATVYSAGSFTEIGGQPRSHIAALDAGLDTENATEWAPDADFDVYALALKGDTLYAGGAFSTIGGALRNRIAELDTRTGSATEWNPNAESEPGINPEEPNISGLAVGENVIYASGNFAAIGGQRRNDLAALDTRTGRATTWDPHPHGWRPVYVQPFEETLYPSPIMFYGNTVYFGGSFNALDGEPTGAAELRHERAVE